MRPVRAGTLHQAQRTGCAWADFRGQALAECDNRFVGAADGEMQESVRIEQRPAHVPELVEHRAHGHFGCACTIGVAAHAIHDREHHGAVGVRNGNSILVLFAMPDEAQVRVLDLQGSLRHACSHVNSGAIYNTRAICA